MCACMHEEGGVDGETLALKLNVISEQIQVDWRENQWDVVTECSELVTRETEGPFLGS